MPAIAGATSTACSLRVDPVTLFTKVAQSSGEVTGFLEGNNWSGAPLSESPVFMTGIGSGTTYPDYKPAPFIVSAKHDGVDMVTVVTEGIFSYCSFKAKIDTDRWLGPEQATVRCRGEAVGHVTPFVPPLRPPSKLLFWRTRKSPPNL